MRRWIHRYSLNRPGSLETRLLDSLVWGERLLTIVPLFVFDPGDVAERFEESAVVEPVDPVGRGELPGLPRFSTVRAS